MLDINITLCIPRQQVLLSILYEQYNTKEKKYNNKVKDIIMQ